MPFDQDTGRWLGTQGWRQLLTCKKELLDAFDRARQHSRAHEVETYHGIVAEAQFRNWLGDFLPKKFGVTAGYIVSQGASEHDKLPAYDVIVFDQLEAPVLWVEGHPDVTPLGRMRAIPAEYVKAVIEVKAVWDAKAAKKAADHLSDLRPLLAGFNTPGELYPKYLPHIFTSWVVFFDLFLADHQGVAALSNLLPDEYLRGFRGGVVLRGEGIEPEFTGVAQVQRRSNPEVPSVLAKGIKGLFSQTKQWADGNHYSVCLHWFASNFSAFAFELIARLNGTRVGAPPSYHGQPGNSLESDNDS